MRVLIILFGIVLTACMHVPVKSYTTHSSLSPAGAFDCVHRTISELEPDYRILDADQQAGFIRAITSESHWVRMTGEPFYDELTVSILANNDETTLKITTELEASATAILNACSAS